MTQISVVYFFTGAAKLNENFLSGDVLRTFMWLELPGALYAPLSLVAVAIELFLAVALWHHRLRPVAVILGILLHLSIVVLLDQPVVLLAFALLMVGTYPLFLARPLKELGPA